MTATERAAQLGTEHGTRAAEEWWDEADRDPSVIGSQLARGVHLIEQPWWPRPDPDYAALKLLWDSQLLGYPGDYSASGVDIMRAYETAFTAAVEATIRAHCEEISNV